MNGDTMLKTHLGVYWLHEFNHNTDTVPYTVGNFASSNSVMAYGTEMDIVRLDLGAGLQLSDRWDIGLGIIGDFNNNIDVYQAYGNVSYRF